MTCPCCGCTLVEQCANSDFCPCQKCWKWVGTATRRGTKRVLTHRPEVVA